jgi:hypothetical protein
MLLEETEMGVIQCENAEVALSVLKDTGAQSRARLRGDER